MGSLLFTLTGFRLNTYGGYGCKTAMVLTVALVPILFVGPVNENERCGSLAEAGTFPEA